MLVAKCDPAPLSYTKVGGSNPGFGTNKLITQKENIVTANFKSKLISYVLMWNPQISCSLSSVKSRLDWEHRMCHDL